MWYIIIVAFIALLVYSTKQSLTKMKENNVKLIEQGYDVNKQIKVGKYICGHPLIDDEFDNCIIYFKENNFEIIRTKPLENDWFRKGIIELKNIKTILAEDKSSIEKNVTLGRLLLLGPFALAMKKKKKIESAYIVIDWNDGRFDHSTIFEINEENSLVKANKVRNELIKLFQ